MAIDQQAIKKMHKLMLKIAAKYIAAFGVFLVCIFIGSGVLNLSLAPSSTTIWLGVLGTFLVLLGNYYISDAVTRLSARECPQWKWGNIIQSLGFAITVLALIIK